MKIIKCSKCGRRYKYHEERRLPTRCPACGKESIDSVMNIVGKEDFHGEV